MKNNEENKKLAKEIKLNCTKSKKLKGSERRKLKAKRKAELLAKRKTAKEQDPNRKLNGLEESLKELRTHLKKTEKTYRGLTAKQRATKDGQELKKYIAQLRSQIKQTEDDAAKDIEARLMFTWSGIRIYKPLNGLALVDQEANLVADADIKAKLDLDDTIVKANAANGDFMLILRRVDTSEYKFAALTVTAKDFLKAREQRLQLAYLGGDEVVAKLIIRGLDGKIDKRLKDPRKIIDKHTEDFLSIFSYDVILRDIQRMLNNM